MVKCKIVSFTHWQMATKLLMPCIWCYDTTMELGGSLDGYLRGSAYKTVPTVLRKPLRKQYVNMGHFHEQSMSGTILVVRFYPSAMTFNVVSLDSIKRRLFDGISALSQSNIGSRRRA